MAKRIGNKKKGRGKKKDASCVQSETTRVYLGDGAELLEGCDSINDGNAEGGE
jgi:hypothetical protein